MRQSNVIFGTLLLAFVIFITVRGQLPAWLDLFKPKLKPTASSSGSGGGFDIGGILSGLRSGTESLFSGSGGGGQSVNPSTVNPSTADSSDDGVVIKDYGYTPSGSI